MLYNAIFSRINYSRNVGVMGLGLRNRSFKSARGFYYPLRITLDHVNQILDNHLKDTFFYNATES